ncbi:MAG: hypothetical protein KJ600_02320 [Nanoarchaeota archaeon]|nr:hypothetical protein [Nanoarchaeota archaeon]MBU1103370.1 hypothetical protein [Nanoarchaeota archaeon]
MNQKIILIFVIVSAVLFAGAVEVLDDKPKDEVSSCSKEENCRVENENCQYVWFTGRCNTPEYVSQVMNKCEDGSGPCQSEALSRENVVCTCENNKCVTYG